MTTVSTYGTRGPSNPTGTSSVTHGMFGGIKRDGGITLSTLFREAKVNGWRDVGARPTPEEIEARRRESAKRAATQKAEEARQHAEAASKAAQIWEAASTRADNHAYLIRKRVKAYGVRVHDGSLVVPVRNGDELHSLQYIAPDGIKKFLNGGPVSGCHFSIGDLNGAAALCICEGYVTGASIHEATGYPVVVALNAGNLLPVAKAMRERPPELHLIVCADGRGDTQPHPGSRWRPGPWRPAWSFSGLPVRGED